MRICLLSRGSLHWFRTEKADDRLVFALLCREDMDTAPLFSVGRSDENRPPVHLHLTVNPIRWTNGEWISSVCFWRTVSDRMPADKSTDIRCSIENNGWSKQVCLKNWQADLIRPLHWIFRFNSFSFCKTGPLQKKTVPSYLSFPYSSAIAHARFSITPCGCSYQLLCHHCMWDRHGEPADGTTTRGGESMLLAFSEVLWYEFSPRGRSSSLKRWPKSEPVDGKPWSLLLVYFI